MHPFVIVLAIIVIVYWDATKNKIGKIEGGKGFLNMSAGAWAFSILFLPLIGFIMYLVNRSKLIGKAKEKPVISPKRGLKLSILMLFVFLAIGKNAQNNQKNKKALVEAVKTLEQIKNQK